MWILLRRYVDPYGIWPLLCGRSLFASYRQKLKESLHGGLRRTRLVCAQVLVLEVDSNYFLGSGKSSTLPWAAEMISHE